MPSELIYNFVETPLGSMMVGIYEGKCCLLDFAERKSLQKGVNRIEGNLQTKFKQGAHELIDEIQKQLDSYFDGELKEFNIPLFPIGSEFQKSVWKLLQQIPFGSTSTYGTIAKQLGKPLSSRAVGKANGSNYIAIVIPCHRVIGEDGSLTGYGGGIPRKQKLLEMERKFSSNSDKLMEKWFTS